MNDSLTGFIMVLSWLGLMLSLVMIYLGVNNTTTTFLLIVCGITFLLKFTGKLK